MSSSSSNNTMKDLAKNQSGAVMMTGVFMGAFLIGATWLIFGMARATIFRERVQEAADAAAFSSAAIHAKGMNLIAAINLVFFAITAIWVVLRVFEHAMHALQQVIGNPTNCGPFYSTCHLNSCTIRAVALSATGVGAAAGGSICQMASVLKQVRDVNKRARLAIGDQMARFFPKLSKVQDGVAVLAPLAGTAASVTLGLKFQHFTIAVGPSNVPVDGLVSLAQKATGTGGGGGDPLVDRPLGLPVSKKKFGYLCNRTAKVALTKVKDAFKAIPFIGKVLDFPVIKQAIDAVINGTSGYIENEFCSDNDSAGRSDRLFKERGPKVVFGHAENGNDLMQIWAFTNGQIDDRDAPRVATAGRKFNAPVGHHGAWYVAQAEFYYDCNQAWGDGDCNALDNAMFNMKWRARLRRLRTPSIGAELGRYLRDALFSGPVKNAVQDALGLGGPDSRPKGSDPTLEQRIGDELFGQAFDWMKGKASDAAGVGNGASGSTPGGSYH